MSNNHPSFHLLWKENLLKHQKFSKYYETDCTSAFDVISFVTYNFWDNTLFALFLLIPWDNLAKSLKNTVYGLFTKLIELRSW